MPSTPPASTRCCLATGSERYRPYGRETRPAELLTQANAILGQGQLSLAKYLFIADAADDPPDMGDVPAFLAHCLERFDPARDLHFQTRTTMDTLDYSGSGFNEGSKLVFAARGPAVRDLPEFLRSGWRLPDGFDHAAVAFPGVACVSGPPCEGKGRSRGPARRGDRPGPPAAGFPADRAVRRRGVQCEDGEQPALDGLHPLRPGRGRVRRGGVLRGQALGLPRPAGGRRSPQTAPRPPRWSRTRR